MAQQKKTRQASARPRSSASKRKDPRGGLTPQGRAYFARKEGAHLQPGVQGPADTLTKMRRKGSYLRRFFGRAKLPPLVDKEGHATRFALSAHAWGESVPKTQAQARQLAQKGQRLLDRYQRERKKAQATRARKAPARRRAR